MECRITSAAELLLDRLTHHAQGILVEPLHIQCKPMQQLLVILGTPVSP